MVKLDQDGSNWIQEDQLGSIGIKLVSICLHWFIFGSIFT